MDKITEELTRIIKDNDFDEKYLIKYKDVYEISKKRHSQICKICEDLEKEELPYDCLCRPSYCVKSNYDFEVILLYNELQENIEQKNYG